MDNSWREATHRTVLSLEPDTMVFPSGLTATLYTPLACPSNILLTWPDARSHTLVREGRFRSKISLNSNPVQREATHRNVWSSDPDMMDLPLGLMATLRTQPVCPWSVDFHSPVASYHTLVRVGGFRRQG